jgi:NAD(P)H-hydrate repair Nnr-like enzyme with NAD(P)H-hydrate dehydratase domain
VVVLKGARTVVATPHGTLRVCRRGTPALGTAGTGDVLAGVVASQLATQPVEVAAAVAVCLHAVAGELAACGDRGLLAREVADALPRALLWCRAGADTGQ